ncbi:hypothetical protein SISSUDRAFT_754222 [Sistotremastrum suecicum HHB10207 ss-3]|uniref:Uncharacterized protein n=1 Tax=Sistotremastrum suecicum HHB10207 ss-3 TaxID=1314776 RepID=A0A166DES8_9AGAM|nr:hypothetical protein SISSUDRAFT_754222 [Sistotremastrum suecicum HHB10207 ss-3]
MRRSSCGMLLVIEPCDTSGPVACISDSWILDDHQAPTRSYKENRVRSPSCLWVRIHRLGFRYDVESIRTQDSVEVIRCDFDIASSHQLH